MDATLDFGFEGHLLHHKGQIGQKLVFDMTIPLLYTLTIFISLFCDELGPGSLLPVVDNLVEGNVVSSSSSSTLKRHLVSCEIRDRSDQVTQNLSLA